MTRDEWLTSTDPTAMLAWMQSPRKASGAGGQSMPPPNVAVSDRGYRLFACAAFRAGGGGQFVDNAWGLATAEGAADGSVSTAELAEVHATFPEDLVAEYLLLADAAGAARFVVAHLFPGHGDARGEADSMQVADALRDMIGDPFEPVTLPCRCHCGPRKQWPVTGECPDCASEGWCPWLTPDVVSLAWAAYSERNPDGTLDRARLLVLSDCLEESGCPSETECQACGGMGWTGRIDLSGRRDLSRPCPGKCRFGVIGHPILAQLRQDRPLYRGAWSIDLLTERS